MATSAKRRDEPQPEVGQPDVPAAVERGERGEMPRGRQPAPRDERSSAEQALINEELAIESGEENVV